MSNYYYEVFKIPHEDYAEPELEASFRGGVVADIVGGLKDERLVVIAYEIIGDEDEQEPA